jgi:serine/threonine-protein kinase RIO1
VPLLLLLLLLLLLQVLFKMLNRGVFSEIYGCVSTGKEANVYHACAPDGVDLAIKVYKTSILVFKDRDRWAWKRGWGARFVLRTGA